jgi:hypothetical protein
VSGLPSAFYWTLTVPTMPGWIVQWYWNVPADENVLEKVAPAAIEPEFQAPPSAVEVCVTVSLFVHVTVPPTETAIGFGAKAVVVNPLAPLGIETVTAGLKRLLLRWVMALVTVLVTALVTVLAMGSMAKKKIHSRLIEQAGMSRRVSEERTWF